MSESCQKRSLLLALLGRGGQSIAQFQDRPDQVEKLAKGADTIVHSTMHPALAPDKDSGMPPPVYYRQAATADLGAMAQRAGARYLMLTHLAPPLGAQRHGPYKVPGGPLTEADYRKVAEAGGFTGITIVGTDLATIRLPAK
jgi:ribonuclease Z